MLRSWVGTDKEEFQLIREDVHVEEVTQKISSTFDKYFESMVEESKDFSGLDKLKVKFGGTQVKTDLAAALATRFDQAIEMYEKEASKYRKILDQERMQDYIDLNDSKQFKRDLEKECPVIRNSLHSTAEVMKEWKASFRRASPQDLQDTVYNIFTFAENYAEDFDNNVYRKIDHWNDFGFNTLDGEEAYFVGGVIGGGIQSALLYHLYPNIFPARGILALYFLTEEDNFRLPSKTSEFIMINDDENPYYDSFKIDHNYFYPYTLTSLYSIRLFRMIEEKCKDLNVSLDEDYRYVYVHEFNRYVTNQNAEFIQTMIGSDKTKKPWEI